MKPWILTAAICGTAICSPVMAETFNGPTELSMKMPETLTINGPAKLRYVKTHSLTVNGPLEFNHLDVKGDAEIKGPVTESSYGMFHKLKVRGPFTALRVEAEDLDVTGPINVSYMKIKKGATILGPLEAKDSEFGDLTISSDTVVLENSVANNIVIKRSSGSQTLELKGKTTVNGNITFESDDGKVITSKDARIKGSIKGAQQEKVD